MFLLKLTFKHFYAIEKIDISFFMEYSRGKNFSYKSIYKHTHIYIYMYIYGVHTCS